MKNIIYTIILINSLPFFVAIDKENKCVIEKIEYIHDYFNDKIDHPLYPNTKWLYHSFVESPDMLNLYKGIDTFQSGEEVIIHLPEYFDALNKDYTYQLTPIGHFAHLYISKEVNTCIDADGDTRPCFAVHGGFKGLKFSWEVSGVRQDKWARENRIQVEVDKEVAKK